MIVASQQRIEHYEIAAYGMMTERSRAMGQTEVADILGEILAEEKAQDEKLTEMTRNVLLPAVLQGREADDEDETPPPGAQNGGRSRSKRSQASAH